MRIETDVNKKVNKRLVDNCQGRDDKNPEKRSANLIGEIKKL